MDILGLQIKDASSQVVNFDFTPIHGTSIHRGKANDVLIGLWYRSGTKSGHLVFSASPGKLIVDYVYRIYSFLIDDPASVDVKKRPPAKSYNDQQSYDLARRWLRDCFTNHKFCPKDTDRPLPTRVIDVGNVHRDPSLFTPPPGMLGKYAALSYCWGQIQTVTLTEERMVVKPVTYPLQTLPQTLRDAIVIASQLGYRFIWIDALCIIQDSVDGKDWERESVNMDKIYGNASLTIAAAAAATTTKGIFSFTTRQKQSGCSLQYRTSYGQAGSVFVDAYAIDTGPEEPLDSRAWALQESLISPRILRYGSKQMSWICNCLEDNANGPLVISPKSLKAANKTWPQVVTDYTARNLTFNSDRLPALAGYAQLLRLNERLYDEYLAGLWRSEFLEQLLWYRSSKSAPDVRPKTRHTPSWSWASIDGAVRFSYWPVDYHSHTEIVSVSVKSSSKDQFSALEAPQQSFLCMHGYVKKLLYEDFFYETKGVPLLSATHKFQSSARKGPDKPSGQLIVDISAPFAAFQIERNGLPSLVCLYITPECGLVLVAVKKQHSSDIDAYERIGLATGSVFEEWFTDTRCGSYKDELLRIL